MNLLWLLWISFVLSQIFESFWSKGKFKKNLFFFCVEKRTDLEWFTVSFTLSFTLVIYFFCFFFEFFFKFFFENEDQISIYIIKQKRFTSATTTTIFFLYYLLWQKKDFSSLSSLSKVVNYIFFYTKFSSPKTDARIQFYLIVFIKRKTGLV